MGLFDFLKKKPSESTPLPAGVPQPSLAASQKPADPGPAAATGTAPVASAPAPAEGTAPTVELTDSLGRRVRISREEYRTKVLPDLLKTHANQPEQLVAVILQAVRDGLAADVLPAANRLTVVDKEVERSLSVLALVQRELREFDSAEATLKELRQKRPDSIAAMVGLGMVADSRGDAGKAEEWLWNAMQKDGNHPDAVHGWLQLRHRAVGDAGYEVELRKAVALPGAWRAPLWLARQAVQTGRNDEAVAIFRDVLERAGNHSDAQVMAAVDLLQMKRHDLIDELLVPRFQPGRHHPHVGLALLHHYLQQEKEVAGAELLHQMHLHYGHVVGNELQPFTAQFDRLRLAKLPPLPQPSATPKVGLYRVERPLWFAGFDDPNWLLQHPKDQNAKSVLFFTLAADGPQTLPAGAEDEFGRLVRSVPLFLAEHVWLSSPHFATAVMSMAENGGWALMGRPWPEEQLASQIPEADRNRTLLVTGVVRVDGEMRRLDLWVYDCAKKQRIGHAASEGKMAELGRMLLQLMAELWPILGGPAGFKPPAGNDDYWTRYAEGLAQHSALVITQAGGMPRDRLYGERYITQWLQATALAEPRWQPGFWLFASALNVLAKLGSPVPKEHARTVAEIFRQSPPNSAFARLAVKPLRAVGLETLWTSRRAEILAAAGKDKNYLAWLQRAEANK